MKLDMLGREQPVILQLLDVPPAQQVLRGVAMELEDCAFPLLAEATATDKAEEAFRQLQGFFVPAFSCGNLSQ